MAGKMSVDALAALVLKERSHGVFDYGRDTLEDTGFEYAETFRINVGKIITLVRAKTKAKAVDA